jgi:hypothetical protein
MSLELLSENLELGLEVPKLPGEPRFAEHKGLDLGGPQLAPKDAVLDDLPAVLLQFREGFRQPRCPCLRVSLMTSAFISGTASHPFRHAFREWISTQEGDIGESERRLAHLSMDRPRAAMPLPRMGRAKDHWKGDS